MKKKNQVYQVSMTSMEEAQDIHWILFYFSILWNFTHLPEIFKSYPSTIQGCQLKRGYKWTPQTTPSQELQITVHSYHKKLFSDLPNFKAGLMKMHITETLCKWFYACIFISSLQNTISKQILN